MGLLARGRETGPAEVSDPGRVAAGGGPIMKQ
jgi:hypothetical protein